MKQVSELRTHNDCNIELSGYITNGEFICDNCGSSPTQGQMHRCDECDFDLCHECHTKNSADIDKSYNTVKPIIFSIFRNLKSIILISSALDHYLRVSMEFPISIYHI